MAVILADGFDFYAAATDLTQIGPWGSVTAAIQAVTRFGLGKSISLGGGIGTNKDAWPFGNTSNTVFFAVAQNCNTGAGTANSGFVSLRESTIAQVTIEFSGTDQTIKVRTGGTAGTVVGTFTSAFPATTWNHWQVKTVIHNTAGEVHIRKNGNTVDDFVVTGINTRGGTANNYINGVSLSNPNAQATYFDDFLIYDSSGAAPNDFVGDIRSYPLLPAANTAQKDFTSNPLLQDVGLNPRVSGTTNVKAANVLMVSPTLTAVYDGTITKITVKLAAALTGHLQAAVYDNGNAGNAGSVLATSTAVTNPALGLVDLIFPSPPAVLAGQVIRLALNADASVSMDGGAANANWFQNNSTTYGIWPTNPVLTGTQTIWYVYATLTPSNYASVNEALINYDTTFNYATTLGNSDLYTLQSLPTTPLNIICAQLRVAARKSDTGVRGGQSVLKSGTTTDLGTGVLQATSYGPLLKMYPTDPNTGAAWTAAAINTLQAGIKVST